MKMSHNSWGKFKPTKTYSKQKLKSDKNNNECEHNFVLHLNLIKICAKCGEMEKVISPMINTENVKKKED